MLLNMVSEVDFSAVTKDLSVCRPPTGRQTGRRRDPEHSVSSLCQNFRAQSSFQTSSWDFQWPDPRGFIWKGKRKPQRCVMAGRIARSLSPRSLAHPKPEDAGSAAPGGMWLALPDTRGRPRTAGCPCVCGEVVLVSLQVTSRL